MILLRIIICFSILLMKQSFANSDGKVTYFPLRIHYNAEECYIDSENRIMQSFYINKAANKKWYSFDTSNRERQIIKIVKNNAVLKVMEYTGENSIGHLDAFYVDDNVVWATDKYTQPSIVKLMDGLVIKRFQYPFHVVSNQVLAVNRYSPNEFILWAGDKPKEKTIFLGRFNTAKTKIAFLTKTSINFPQEITLQGLAYNGIRLYALTGEANKEMRLYIWNMSMRKLERVYSLIFDSKAQRYDYLEPEGLQVSKFYNKESLYIGYVIRRKVNGGNQFLNCIANFNTNNL